MRVHLVKERTIEDFVTIHARGRSSFYNWLENVQRADWETTVDIAETFGSVDFLGKSSSRVVFDVGGNIYRMICQYFWGKKNIHLYICWIGTHAEYDELCNNGEQYTINKY